MSFTKLKFLFLVTCLLYVCNSNAIAENGAVIKRVESNDSVPIYFWEPSVFGDNRICSQQYLPQNNTIEITLNLPYPKVYEVAAFHGTLLGIYVTPGDSVTYCVKQNENKSEGNNPYYIEFYGKNAAHYNYNIIRNSELSWTSFFKKGDSLEKYKQTTLMQYNAQMSFLTNYIKKYAVSEGFINWAEADIKNEYFFRLYLPLILGNATMKDVPQNYFSDAKIAVNDLSKYYSFAINAYIQFYLPNIYSNFNKIYNDFIHNESGERRAYLLSSVIGIFAEKQNRNYFNELLQAIDKSPAYVSDSIYLDYIKKCKTFYLSVDEQLPDSVLNKAFLISYGNKEKISLREVLEMYKDKALYIDFWASWCGPCRKDISQSENTKKYLENSQIEYLYISIDSKEKDWIAASDEEKINKNQFLLCDSKNSPLLAYLELKFIPRYLLISKEHKVKDFAAPGPTIEDFDALKESINVNIENTQIYTIHY